MARSADPTVAEEAEEEGGGEIWGTWEELLLACAVNRHGTASWDSVAMEVQARSPSAPNLLTPQHCRVRYRLLQRRFGAADSDGVDLVSGHDSVPWLEELRKLRVAELRREVARYDVSIVSLQLKVKRLKEEREQSLREAESGEAKPDPEAKEGRKDGGSPGSTADASAGDRVSGRSFKESNSTDSKGEAGKHEGDGGKPKDEVVGDGGGDEDPATGGDEKVVVGEASYNGSSDTIAKAEVATSPGEAEPARLNEVGESGESVAESKGRGADAEGEKESSEMQSSASLSRRRRGRRRTEGAGSGGGEEAEGEEVSKRISVAETQPLAAFLEIIRSHKYGPVFERRLESQVSERYSSTIRQHVDLDMVRAKLERGAYTRAEYFRDLLLLCTNAIVFFPDESNESIAAVHLRELITKGMANGIPRHAQPAHVAKEPTPSSPPLASQLTADPDLASSLLEKPGCSGPLIACKKRSSISTRAPAKAAKKEREEKPDPEPELKYLDTEETSSAKKKTNEKSSLSGPRGLRTSKTRGSNGSGSGCALVKSPNPAPPPPRLSPTPDGSTKGVKKSSATVSLSKKRSAASFLNRMKRSSPASNGALLESLKSSTTGGGGRAADQKKTGRGDSRKEQGSRHGSGTKKVAEVSPPVKRSVGRPPKRVAPPPVPPPAKRAREDPEAAAGKARKRGRR